MKTTAPIQTYKDLIVWQKSMELCQMIYLLTESLPKLEMFGLSSQMRRCTVSIPSHIAEDKTRSTRNDYRRFLAIAHASTAELETQCILSDRIFNPKDPKIFTIIIEIKKMLSRMISKLRTS